MLSIIITCKNAEEYVRQCIDSVLCQECGEREVILVSDNSHDPVCKIMAEYHDAHADIVRLVIKDNNHLAGGARNMGLRIAKGEFVAFVDGDDWISPGMYSALLSEFDDSLVDMACCNYNEVFMENGQVSPRILWPAVGKCSLPSAMAVDLFLRESYCWNLVYRHSLLQRIGFEFFEDTIYDDLACHVAFAASRKVAYLPEQYCWHRKYKGSTIESADTDAHCTIIGATRKFVSRMKALGLHDKFKVQINQLLVTYLFKYMHYLMLRGSVDISSVILEDCARTFVELGGNLDPEEEKSSLYALQMNNPLAVVRVLQNSTLGKGASWR